MTGLERCGSVTMGEERPGWMGKELIGRVRIVLVGTGGCWNGRRGKDLRGQEGI